MSESGDKEKAWGGVEEQPNVEGVKNKLKEGLVTGCKEDRRYVSEN